jgi:hypothetical protein
MHSRSSVQADGMDQRLSAPQVCEAMPQRPHDTVRTSPGIGQPQSVGAEHAVRAPFVQTIVP